MTETNRPVIPNSVETADPSGRFAVLVRSLERLERGGLEDVGVLPGTSPIPGFGSLSSSKLATIGINPSNREFLDENGRELCGQSRRFHTLASLCLTSWLEVDARHLGVMIDTHDLYFAYNPYHRWFDKLDAVIAGANVSYYDPAQSACHLDIVPFATGEKWSGLFNKQRSVLIEASADLLGLTLRSSSVGTVILNGNSVARVFERLAGVRFEKGTVPSWSLRRKRAQDVAGIAYKGWVDHVAGVNLGRRILVLGFNHNLQGSFGVSTQVVAAIRDWIAQSTAEADR